MKLIQNSFKPVLIFFALCSTINYTIASTYDITKISTETSFTVNTLISSTNESFEQYTGKKLTWKEKIGLTMLRRRLKKAIEHHPELANADIVQQLGCSKIILKNGDLIEADIIQITPTEIKYKRCGKPNDPEIIISKKDVLSVKADDGEIIFRNTGNSNYATNNSSSDGPKTDGMAIASLATGAAGLLIGLFLIGIVGILAGIVAIVLGGISIQRIKKNPEKYAGKGMAWAGLICGTVITGLFLLILALI